MANNNLCAGSALFMVELDNLEEPGKIYGGDQNGGPITIIDTSPEGVPIGNDVIATYLSFAGSLLSPSISDGNFAILGFDQVSPNLL